MERLAILNTIHAQVCSLPGGPEDPSGAFDEHLSLLIDALDEEREDMRRNLSKGNDHAAH